MSAAFLKFFAVVRFASGSAEQHSEHCPRLRVLCKPGNVQGIQRSNTVAGLE